MKRIFISLAFVTSLAHATAPTVAIKDFNFNYQDPTGRGSASDFSYGTKGSFGTVEVEVEKALEDFKLKVSGTVNGEYVLKKAPALLTKAQTISLTAFNLSFQDRLSLSLEDASFVSPDDELALSRLSLDCSRDLSLSELQDQVISGCLQSMTLKSAKFSSQSLADSNFISNVTSSLAAAIGSGVGIKGLDLKLSGGKYQLSAEVKAQISGRAKSHGQVSYDPAKKLLTIKINEVKFSVLNVTTQVFDELKKKENEKMKVSKPYVYLTLN